jgi:hypothetical protein
MNAGKGGLMFTAPTYEDLADNEIAIRVDRDLDRQGCCRLTAFWRNDFGGVRSQVFHANLEDFVNREHLDGRRVTALDEHTHRILDGIGLHVPCKGL